MKCPICGQELKPGKKDPNYLLCYNCKKKFKMSAQKASSKAVKKEAEEEEIHAPKYANIPPKHVREKREQEMRRAYDEMLAVGNGKKKKPARRIEEPDDDFYEDDYEDEKMSKAPIIILAIAILIVIAVIAFLLLR